MEHNMFDFLPKHDEINWDDEVEITQPEHEPVSESELVDNAPEEWIETGRTKRGKPVYLVYAIYAKPANPVLASLADRLPQERPEHKVGDTCPHCLGSGRYSAHRGHFHNEKCYRCHGKGVLDARDIAFLNRREAAKAPVCRVVTA